MSQRVSLSIRSDRRYIRAGYRSNRFVLARIEAPEAPARADRTPANLSFVLDRSGSMGGEKIALARQAVEQAVAALRAEDRFSVVAYDEQVDVVVPGSQATADARREAIEALGRIDARGSTNLGEGWLRGCEQVALRLAEAGVNRCLLLTDGLANKGITDRGELSRHAAELRARGISTSTFGVGRDFDELLLQAMSDAGGGHFYFIEQARQIPDYITSEVGEVLEVVARGALLEVSAGEGTLVEPLTPLAHERNGDVTSIRLGDLVSQQRLELVLRLNFPHGQIGERMEATFRLADPAGTLSTDSTALHFEYADGRTNDLQERDADVDRAVARVFAARAREEALGLNRSGDFKAASATLRKAADRIRRYAGDDREMRAIVARLSQESTAWSTPMAELDRKRAYFASSNLARARDIQGRARKDW
jgi:Ca-activated chloride channel family protein